MASVDASNDPRPLVVVGTGDHARVVLELLQSVRRVALGLVEPLRPLVGPPVVVDGTAVVGDLASDLAWSDAGPDFVVALGDNRRRAEIYQRCVELGCRPIPLVHATATVLGQAVVEPGAQVCAGAVVGVAARIGRDAIVNTSASVDHDVVVGDHAFIAPGARLAGRVIVGEGAFVGIGAVVRQGITIGPWALVAGGAVVVADVPPSWSVAGVPATRMEALSPEGRDES
jgi:sugar O-acyltransferase (sialic acid O-acetyltransferase NeuD family)